MPGDDSKSALSRRNRAQLSRAKKELERTRQEVLERGAKLRKPLGLAKHRVVKFTALILSAIALLSFLLLTILIYVFHSDNGLVYQLTRIIPYPVARVNGDFVSYSDYLFDLRYRKNVASNPSGPASASQPAIDFSSPDSAPLLHELQHASLKQAETNAIIRQLAAANQVSVSRDELDQGIAAIVAQQGGQDKFVAAIKQFYGWDMGDFRNEYELQLLENKLELVLLPAQSAKQRTLAESVLAQAKKPGTDFAALAKKYSEDTASKDNGGDIGYISADSALVPEFKAAALALRPGQVSEVIETQFGFHIIKAISARGNQIRISHILIRYSTDIGSLLADQLKSASTHIYIKLPN